MITIGVAARGTESACNRIVDGNTDSRWRRFVACGIAARPAIDEIGPAPSLDNVVPTAAKQHIVTRIVDDRSEARIVSKILSPNDVIERRPDYTEDVGQSVAFSKSAVLRICGQIYVDRSKRIAVVHRDVLER